MAHFYGRMEGNRGETTRCGTKGSGIVARLGSWTGGVRVHLWWNEIHQENWATVSLIAWNGRGTQQLLYEGPVDRGLLSEMDKLTQGVKS